MGEYLITFRSITYAQRGEKLLEAKGLRCYLSRTPKQLSEQGCGYCIHVFTRDISGAVNELRMQELPWRKVYARSPRGLQEIVL